ncbi:MAG: tetratricopeptide repeat protein [Bacteroidota bacterium]|jgi:outer membrane protein assembly factor BamD (BamD/ComL family)
MKIINKSVYYILSVLFITACSSPKEKSLEQIKLLESNDTIFSPQAIEQIKKAYLDFASKYPDDELAPEFIFKAAQRCNVIAQHQQALELFQSIIDKYPQSRVSEEALFLQAYIYENSLQNLGKAKEVYNTFILKYPSSELAEDAKMAIENLGKSPEQVLEDLIHNAPADSIQ